jgi:hypothetical protein
MKQYLAILPLAVLLLTTACESSAPPRARRHGDQETTPDQDHLALALESLKTFHETENPESKRQLLYQLNRWIGNQSSEENWRPDPQVNALPRRFRELPELTTLDQMVFAANDDSRYLVEAYRLRAVAQRIGAKATRQWLEGKRKEAGDDPLFVEPELDSAEHRLAVAAGLFDWSVRHTQLDPLLPFPAVPVAAPGANAQKPGEQASPPELGIPGPGYRYYPNQVLLYGHGDAWQRARIFILLARQLDLDAVMLAVDDRGPGSRANLWCPAVRIDKQLYLFDSALGLPIPGEAPGSIATLAEVQAHPELLRKLDEDDDGKALTYPVSSEQLKSVAALVDAASEALSRRMQLLERRLTGENTLVLSVAPSEIAERIRACPGLENVKVRLWTLPFETRLYRNAVERLARRDPQIERQRIVEEGLYLPMIEQARRLNLIGRIEPQDDNPGAMAFYLDSRKADEWIDQMATSEEARRRIGAPPVPPEYTPEQRQTVLTNQAAQLRLNKQHASYWIGLAQYDLEQFESAIHWLKDRTLDAYPKGVWTHGARYNLGRTYEALGRTEDARRLYFQSESPQRHGDLLRARMLRSE